MSGQVGEGGSGPSAADRARIIGAVVESARAERVRREELELARREAILESLRPPRHHATRLRFNDLFPREIVLP